MRPSCLDCAIKHVGQAIVLVSEAKQGYPEHLYLGMAHLAEASAELLADFPAYAALIRTERLTITVTEAECKPRLMTILRALLRLSRNLKYTNNDEN